MRIFKT